MMKLLAWLRRGWTGAASRLASSAAVLVLLAAAASAAPTMSVEPSHSEVPEGEVFWLDIVLNDEVLAVTGYHLVLDFDEGILEVLAVEEGGLPLGYPGQTFMNWTDEGTASSALDVSGAVLGGSVDGPGVLVSVEFRAVEQGTSPVEFSLAVLRDIDNQPISVSPEDGDVEVTPVGRVYFDPSHSETSEFERFWVDVCFDEEVLNVTGYEFVIDFDEHLLDVVSVQEGDLPDGYPGETFLYWTIDGTPTEALIVNGAVLGGSVDGPGSVVRIEFEALAAGVSDLTFSSIDLRDMDNIAVPSIGEEGDVEIGSVGRVYVDPSYTSVWENSDFCVDIAIDGLVHGLTGFHLLIDFDEHLLEPTGVQAAGLMTGYPGYPGSTVLYWSGEGQPSDAVLIDGAFLGGSVDGPGALVTLCFHASSPGITPVEFVVVEFRDLENDAIPVGSIPGEVEVESEPSNASATSWGAIKAMYR